MARGLDPSLDDEPEARTNGTVPDAPLFAGTPASRAGSRSRTGPAVAGQKVAGGRRTSPRQAAARESAPRLPGF
jgi:hypothetical protein